MRKKPHFCLLLQLCPGTHSAWCSRITRAMELSAAEGILRGTMCSATTESSARLEKKQALWFPRSKGSRQWANAVRPLLSQQSLLNHCWQSGVLVLGVRAGAAGRCGRASQIQGCIFPWHESSYEHSLLQPAPHGQPWPDCRAA